jgi:hypothetical protein
MLWLGRCRGYVGSVSICGTKSWGLNLGAYQWKYFSKLVLRQWIQVFHLRVVGFGLSNLKSGPFKNWTLTCPVFECFWISGIQFSDAHCIPLLWGQGSFGLQGQQQNSKNINYPLRPQNTLQSSKMKCFVSSNVICNQSCIASRNYVTM